MGIVNTQEISCCEITEETERCLSRQASKHGHYQVFEALRGRKERDWKQPTTELHQDFKISH